MCGCVECGDPDYCIDVNSPDKGTHLLFESCEDHEKRGESS